MMRNGRPQPHSINGPTTFAGKAIFWISSAVLGLGLVFCNGAGGLSGVVIAEMVLQLFSIALIVACVLHKRATHLRSLDRLLVALIAGVSILALVQLLPMPPAIWTSLAGRAALIADMRSIDVLPGWHAISLSPIASERSLLSLLPPLAIFLGMRCMSGLGRKRIVQFAMVFGLFSALLGIAQINGGSDSELRMFRPTNPSDAVGLFANRNHYASLLAMLLPFSLGWTISEFQRRRGTGPAAMLPVLLPCLSTFLLIIGMLLSHSRAGLLLLALAAIGGLALAWRSGVGRRIVLVFGICGLLAGGFALQIAGKDVVARLTAINPETDSRWPVQDITIDAVHRYGMLGSGLGTFVNSYQSVAPDHQVDQNAVVNHANNDYLELLLEAGWPSAILIVLFLVWYVRVAIPLWFSNRPPGFALMAARAASIAVFLALTHAGLEYQLRKPGIMLLFGLCCALISVPMKRAETSGFPRGRRNATTG